MKTFKGWYDSGETFPEFCEPGEEVNFTLYNYFLSLGEPKKKTDKGFLTGEALEGSSDEFTFGAFIKIGGKYFYKGNLSVTAFNNLS